MNFQLLFSPPFPFISLTTNLYLSIDILEYWRLLLIFIWIISSDILIDLSLKTIFQMPRPASLYDVSYGKGAIPAWIEFNVCSEFL